MPTTVVHIKNSFDIYIGRPNKKYPNSIWGNPFIIGRDGDRKEVISKYEEWIVHQDHLIKNLHLLKNKILGCYCKPLECHGDVLCQLSNFFNETPF